MIVLDADSIMTGEAVSSLVRLMEVNPRTGHHSKPCQSSRKRRPYLAEFSIRVPSLQSSFRSGTELLQQGAGNYWGHNAIIRVSPFLTSCGLPNFLDGRHWVDAC